MKETMENRRKKQEEETKIENTQKVFISKNATFVAPEAKSIKGWGKIIKFNRN